MSSHPSLEFRLLDWSDALDSEGRPDPASAINELLKKVDTVIGADLVSPSRSLILLVASMP